MQHRLSYHISRCLMCPREYCRLILRMSIRSSVSSFGPNQLYLYGRCPADSSGTNQTRCSQGGNPKVLASDLVFHYCPKPSTKSHEGNSSAHQVFATASHSNGPAHAASTMCKTELQIIHRVPAGSCRADPPQASFERLPIFSPKMVQKYRGRS